MITFLVTIERRVLRFGFSGGLIDIIKDYQIASDKKVEALIVEQYKYPEPVDFRMYFRVKPSSQSDVNLFLKEEKVNLIDISLGGAKFTYPKTYLFHPEDTVRFKLVIGRDIFNLDAKVHEVWSRSENVISRNLQYVSVEFHHLDRQLEASLGRVIIDTERQLLSEGKI
jgi:c-di-GMP-binding flagellar brake protein YcgR